jgi:hypothetical protein
MRRWVFATPVRTGNHIQKVRTTSRILCSYVGGGPLTRIGSLDGLASQPPTIAPISTYSSEDEEEEEENLR